MGVAWGSSALRALVLPDLPSLCRGKTGDSTQLPSLQLFPILEFGAGAGRSFYRPHQVGEGPPCPATFLTRKPVPGVGGNALSLGSALKLFTRAAQLWARGTSRAVTAIRQAGPQAACPAPPQGSICLCPRAGKASIVPLQRALVWHLRSLWGGMRPQFVPAQPWLPVAGGWRRSRRWRGSTGKRRELGWCDSLTGPPEKYNPGELELNPSAAGEIKSGLCPGPAWGQEPCPQPEQQLAVPSAQEDDTSRWER